MRKRFKSGQSLIEVLIAFTVSVVVGIALVSAGLVAQRASISARNKSQATRLAQEYLEQIRLIRDVKGFTFIPISVCYRIDRTSNATDPSTWTLPNITGTQSQCNLSISLTNDEQVPLNGVVFYRRLNFSEITANVSKRVIVKVIWKEGTNDRIVTAETVLSQWCEGAVTGTPVAGVCP